MKRMLRPLGLAGALILTTSMLSPASAASPTPEVPHAISVVDANGFVATSEIVTPQGAVIDTFKSGDTTVKVLGSAGSSISFYPSSSGKEQTLGLAMTATWPKTDENATSYQKSGRTVVGDLVALGMPRELAEQQFGTMETGGAYNPYLSDSSPAPASTASAVALSVPVWATQCASINEGAGHITGYGCSVYYRTYANGSDWWFNDTMKVSAVSDDTSWWHPKRIVQLGWRVTWAANNYLYDWDPVNTVPTNCGTYTAGVTSPYGGVTIGAPVCPTNIGPWTVSATRSGGIWNGYESGANVWEAAVAAQAVHNPPNAAASYQSAWTLTYAEF